MGNHFRCPQRRFVGRSFSGDDQQRLRRVQQYLANGEITRAWAEGQLLRASANRVVGKTLDAEALVTLGVAAAAAGRLCDSAMDIQHAMVADTAAATTGSAPLAKHIAKLASRVHGLLEQSRGHGAVYQDVVYGFGSPPEVLLPSAWAGWSHALPKVVEYVGPVKVQSLGAGQRGLFAARRVTAGEVLLLALPIGCAGDERALELELQHACIISERSRCRLACLTSGSAEESSPAPDAVMEMLTATHDMPPNTSTITCSRLELSGIIARNKFVKDGRVFLYALPSMLNHSCAKVNTTSTILAHLDGAILVRAECDTEAGEELFHQYFDVDGSLESRSKNALEMGFTCTCLRCNFENTRLPGTDTAEAISAATAAFHERLRPKLRALKSSVEGGCMSDAVVGSHVAMCQTLLQELTELIRAVEIAALPCINWGLQEVVWSVIIVLPLCHAALWCCLQCSMHSDAILASGTEGSALGPAELTALKCELLFRIAAASEHSERHSHDHIKNLHLLWHTLEDLRGHGGSVRPHTLGIAPETYRRAGISDESLVQYASVEAAAFGAKRRLECALCRIHYFADAASHKRVQALLQKLRQ